jgi:trimeric autotransporter adhesin
MRAATSNSRAPKPSVARQGTALAIAIQMAFGPGINALAQTKPVLPQGATVANGQVSISNPTASSLQINASSGAIVNWRTFSIGAGGQVQIGLPSSSSAMLNRVTGAEASQLLGSLQSNGRIFLINPNGIVVGAGARIDTNSFIASTLDLSDGDFLAGKLRFLAASGAGSIRNDGVITAGPGGRIALIAPDVQNTGIIQAPGGQILLAAGRKLEISSLDFEGVTFEIQAPTDSVLNLGKLLADNGAVSAFAGSLRNSGEIRAAKMVRDSDGSIRLMGSNEVIITSDSVIRADSSAAGTAGGSITIQSAQGTNRVAGVVSANAAEGKGGSIQLLGERVAVDGGTLVDASGSAGGGQVLVGGDFQGNNAAVQNASRVFVGEGASLKADAIAQGDGGKVIVWADENTRYHGNLSVRGGANGGNGGNAEVSGKQNLEFTGGADLGAAAGRSGTLLLDPLDILVSSAGGILPSVVDQFSDFAGNVVTITPTKMATINGTISLQAERDIYFMDAVTLTLPGAGLNATAGGTTFNSVNGGNVFLNENISTTGGAVTLRGVGISGAGTITTTGGAVDLTTSGSLTYSSAIDSGGGAVNLASQLGSVNNSNVNAGAGAIQVTGQTGVFSGIFTTTGSASLTSNAGSLSGDQVTADTVNLTATGGSISVSANAANRVNASSTSSSVVLSNLGGPLRIGTVSGPSAVQFISSGGIEQASGGLVTTPFLSVFASNSAATTGSAAAPLRVALPAQSPLLDLRLQDQAAPAYVDLVGAPALSRLTLTGTVAGIGATSITGASNLPVLALSDGGTVLNANATSSGSLLTGFVLNVSNGGLNSTSLDLAGANISATSNGPMSLGTVAGASLNATAAGAVSIGTATTTGSSGISVSAQKCDLSFSVCTDVSPITAGTLTAGGTGSVQLAARDNGDVNATTISTAGGSVTVSAGSLYANSTDRGPNFNKRFVTTGNINLGTVTSAGSFQAINRGAGNVTIANPATAGGSVSVQAGTSYNHDGNNSTPNILTPSTINVAGLTGTSVNVTNNGTGALSASGNLVATTSSLSVNAADGALTALGAHTSQAGSSFTSSRSAVSLGTITTTNSNAAVTVSAQNDIAFQSVTANGATANVNMTSTLGSIKTTLDNAGADISTGGTVTLTANDAVNGVIGDASFARPLDIVAGATRAVTLSAGKNIGDVGREVNVDTGGVISATSSGGQFFVSAETMAGVAKTVTGIKLSASASGMGVAGTSTFTSQDLSVNAVSDGSTITIGDVVQSANRLDEFRFNAAGSGLNFGNVSLTTATGFNQLSLTSNGPLTQAAPGTNNIAAGKLNLAAGGGDVTVGNVTSASAVILSPANDNSITISGANITARNLLGDAVNVTGANVSLGLGTTTESVRSTGTRRGFGHSSFDSVAGQYPLDELTVNASGSLTTAWSVASATSARLTGNGVTIGGGGSVSGGSFVGSNYIDTASLQAGAGSLNVSGLVSAADVSVQGAVLNTGNVAASRFLTVGNTGTSAITTGTLSGTSGLTVNSGSFSTGNMSTSGTLNITANATGSQVFAPTVSMTASSATINADNGIDLVTNAPTLTASTVRLNTSTGDINANLTGTTNLTLNTGGKFTVTSTGTLTRLDVTADGSIAGAGAGSFVNSNGSNQAMTVVGPANALAVNLKSNTGISENYRETSSAVTDMTVATTGALGAGSSVFVSTPDANITTPSVALTSGSVQFVTGGDLNLTSVTTSGAVTASTSGTGKNINVERIVTLGGGVNLTTSTGNIAKAGNQALQIDARNTLGAASGTVNLSAANGSIGTGAAPLLTSGAFALNLNGKNDIAVDAGIVPVTNLSITSSAGGTGAIAVTNSNYAGLSVTRSGTDLVLSGVNPTLTGSFELASTDGGIRVASDILNVTNLTLNAAYNQAATADLTIQASGAPRTIAATGQVLLQAGRDVLVAADNVAAAGVTVLGNTTYFQANRNVEITAGTALGANALVQGAFNRVNAGNDLKISANGGSALLNATSTSGQNIQVGHDVLVTGGSTGIAGATAGMTSAGSQSLNIGNNLVLQGGASDGATARLQAVFSQSFSQGANNITVAGGSGVGASASITGTSQSMPSPNGSVTLQGGSGSGAFAEIVATTSSQNIGNQCINFSCPPLTDQIAVLGGSGAGAYASLRAVGSQTLRTVGDVRVIGGSGVGANAEILSTGVGQSQNIGENSTSSNVPTQNILVQAGLGGTARIQAAGSQTLEAGADISVLGGPGANMTASIESTGGFQTIGNARNANSSVNPGDNITVQGGSGTGAAAWIRAATGQNVDAGQNITLTGGTTGAFAEISTAAGFQTVGNLNSTFSFDQTNLITLQGGAGNNAYAKMSSGGGQSVSSSTGITLVGGAGDASGALLMSTSVGQTVNTVGALNITGGSGSAPGLNETGIRNTTGGLQTVNATAGIVITGGGFGSDTWIKEQAAGGSQTISTQGALVLQAPTAGAGITSIESGTGGQSIVVGDVIGISNNGGTSTRITSGANQSITADAMSITLASTNGAATRAEVSAVGNQVVTLNGGVAPATLTVANFSGAAGSSARLTAGGTQTIAMNYFNAGKMQIGDVNALGESLVDSVGNQTIVVGGLTIQGGATAAATSKLLAGTPTTGTMLVSTLNGPIEVLGGAAGSAAMDPLLLNGVSNGSILVVAGAGSTAYANVTAGTINMAATNGNMAVLGGGAPATVLAANAFNLAASGGLTIAPAGTGASITAANGGIITLGGPCNGCVAGLFGPFNVTAGANPTVPYDPNSALLNLYVSDIFFNFNDYDEFGELTLAEDGTLTYNNRRRGLNQCY